MKLGKFISFIFLVGVFSNAVQAQEGTLVEWLSFEEAVARSEEEPRKIFIDVYTDWCGWCKVMDKNTFSNETIAAYLNENYYPVKLDGEFKDVITFRGHEFKFVNTSRRGYHELPASLLQGKLSYPTVVFLDEGWNIIQILPGYQKPRPFDAIMRFYGDNHYKTTPWDQYEKSFDSKVN